MRLPALLLFAAIAMLPVGALAQTAPLGRWKTVDDETGKAKAIVEIRRARDGSLEGRIVDLLQPGQDRDARCEKCSGANRDKPILGMTILWGLREQAGRWTGGSILDPEGGRTYKARLDVVNANRLGVAGCFAFICREQVWLRE